MAYKGFGPSTKTLDGIDTELIQSVQEQGVQSSVLGPSKLYAGEKNTITGFAYSGGGRGIVRVDVSIDNGSTWKSATLKEGSEQDMHKAWAWTFWEVDFDIPTALTGFNVPSSQNEMKELSVICKATDASYNVQPDSLQGNQPTDRPSLCHYCLAMIDHCFQIMYIYLHVLSPC